ncbi:MAG: BadF/BadG/BcrA/BcrD ATPase family protein [Acidobacteriota bacterium]
MSPDGAPDGAWNADAERGLLWLGIDGGGTNTRAVLVDRTGVVRGEGRSEAANFLRVGLSAAVTNIKRAVDEACTNAGIEPQQIAAACIGLAGVGNPKHRRQMHEALETALRLRQMTIEIDARVALAGATDLEPGVVIIAGTGSIAYGVNRRREYARAGGWGPAMGDEGSGYYIGRRALEAVVSAYDHRSQPTSMTEMICCHFGVSSPPELPPVIYDSPTKVMREVASLARIVVEAAREGDSAAQSILTEAAMELARAVVAVIERLGLQEQTFRVAYVGGVFEAGDLVITPLSEAIRIVAPRAFIGPPLNPPVIGAARLALTSYMEKEQLVR